MKEQIEGVVVDVTQRNLCGCYYALCFILWWRIFLKCVIADQIPFIVCFPLPTTMALGIVARQTSPRAQKSTANLHFIMEPVHPEHGID